MGSENQGKRQKLKFTNAASPRWEDVVIPKKVRQYLDYLTETGTQRYRKSARLFARPLQADIDCEDKSQSGSLYAIE